MTTIKITKIENYDHLLKREKYEKYVTWNRRNEAIKLYNHYITNNEAMMVGADIEIKRINQAIAECGVKRYMKGQVPVCYNAVIDKKGVISLESSYKSMDYWKIIS